MVQYLALQIWSSECRAFEELLARHWENFNDTTYLSVEELKAQRESESEGTYSNNRCSDRQLNSFVRSRGEEDIPLTALAMDIFDDYRFCLKKRATLLRR